MPSELTLMNLFLGAASKRVPSVRLFRRQVLNLELQPGLRVKAGITGQADIYGIVRSTGRIIELELKSASGSLSLAQKKWKAWCQDWGVAWHMLKAERGETAEQTVDRWVKVLEAEVSK